MRVIKYLLSSFFLLFLATSADAQRLHCPTPASFTVTKQQEQYGTFIQWQATADGIPYYNNNAHAMVPLQLTAVRLQGQAVNCVYQAAIESRFSQIKTIQVSTSNFGDTGQFSHFSRYAETKVCSYGGGVCCDPTATDCSFYFIK